MADKRLTIDADAYLNAGERSSSIPLIQQCPGVLQNDRMRKGLKEIKRIVKTNHSRVKLSFVVEFVALILVVAAWVTFSIISNGQYDEEEKKDKE